MPTYSYARCLDNAYKINWKIDELLGDGTFDLERKCRRKLRRAPHKRPLQQTK